MSTPLIVSAGDGAWLAIDSFVAGRSCGGVRMVPGVTADEVALLARDMTLKYGFVGLPQGGAKAGIAFDPESPPRERLERLAAFARAIAPLLAARIFVPVPDMGTGPEDIRAMLRAAGVPPWRREAHMERSGHYTARGVFVAGREALGHLGVAWAGSRAVVEGFGKVGSALARMLDETGVRVIAICTSHGALYRENGLAVDRLLEAAARNPIGFVETFPDAAHLPAAQLLELPCDVLFPCARQHTIHAGNAGRIRARAIVPGANSPCTDAAEEILFRCGILVVPGFVSNSGGVLGGTMDFAGIPAIMIEEFMDKRMGARIASLLAAARRQGVAVREVAVPLALGRAARIQLREQSPNWTARLFRVGLALHRHGLVPRALTGAASRGYFNRLFDSYAE